MKRAFAQAQARFHFAVIPHQEALVKLLARRDLSESEARSRLGKLGIPGVEMEQALTWARSRGYLDDSRVAENVMNKALSKEPPPARALVENKLKDRGLRPESVSALLNEAFAPGEQAGRLRKYLAKIGRTVKQSTLFGRLVRAGYTEDEITDALEASYED